MYTQLLCGLVRREMAALDGGKRRGRSVVRVAVRLVHRADVLCIDMVFAARFLRLVSVPSELPIQCAADWGSGLLGMGLYWQPASFRPIQPLFVLLRLAF